VVDNLIVSFGIFDRS